MTEDEHNNDHVWIAEQRKAEGVWSERKKLAINTLITTLAGGSIVTGMGFLWWAFSVFVERGGK